MSGITPPNLYDDLPSHLSLNFTTIILTMAPNTDNATRALVVSLKAIGKTTPEVTMISGLSTRQVNRIYARAIDRGFDPNRRPISLRDEYLQDASRSGRPLKRTAEAQESVISKVRQDRYGREKSAANIASELSLEGINISRTTVLRVLKTSGFRKTKLTRKLGLTKKMKKERLDWCLAHQHWSHNDWKNVIWTDETSIILL